jgi:hypothetical protein
MDPSAGDRETQEKCQAKRVLFRLEEMKPKSRNA